MEININIRVERWPVRRLIPRVTNPRAHSEEQVERIAQSICRSGRMGSHVRSDSDAPRIARCARQN
jgi:hypothetical protein